MALPAMITGFGEQSANYGAAVGQSLAQLGQQVGQQLAMREYQRQASAALPAMQQAYKSAFDKMGQGQYADGYMELLNTNLQYGATTNPFIAQFAEQANQTAKQMESAMWRQAQYGERGGAAGSTATPPQGPSMDLGQFFPGMNIPFGGEAGMEAEFVGEDFTQGTPAQREAQRAADREFRTYEDADRAAAEGLPRQQDITRDELRNNMPEDKRKEFDALPDFEQEAAVASANNDRLPPEQKQAVASESGVTQDSMPKTSELWKDPRLEKYFPDAVGIAKPSEKKELRGTGITFTSRGGVNVSTAPQVTNQEVLDVWDKNKEKLEQALDAMDDANMRKLFEEYKDIFSLRAAAQPEGDEFLVGTEPITKQQYEALLTLSNLPVWSEREYTPMVFKQEAPAPAADDAEAQAAAIFGITAPSEGVPAPTATPTPTPFGERYLTPEERERAMTESIRGGIKSGARAVKRVGERVLRGARAIR
jgi:hypothetical protein